MKKHLEEYMKLPYEITVKELEEEEGGGVFLTIPLLGGAAVNAYGSTYDEARGLLENVKKDYFEIWLKEGVPIPEPQSDIEKGYSGKFVLRTRKDLHAQLAAMAREQGVSLNALVNDLINFALGERTARETIMNTLEITHTYHHYIAKVPKEEADKIKKTTQTAQKNMRTDNNYEACA
jgi:antitoxin HicB